MEEEREMDDARKRYEFKKALEKLELQQGDGTELITIYIPPDKQIFDVVLVPVGRPGDMAGRYLLRPCLG